MKLKSIFFALIPVLFFMACKDNDQVGSSIQPDEDLLQVNSNRINVESASLLVDSALSKSSYLFLGEYTDSRLGKTQAEFMTQFDSRLGFGGITIPDTNVVSASSATNGILSNLLTQIDSDYGPIKKISSPTNVRADSVFFVIGYTDFFGDSTLSTVQTAEVYALNRTLEPSASHPYFTNTDVSEFCQRNILLGSKTYTVQDQNTIKVRLDDDFGRSLTEVYKKNSTINSQADFNNFFKGVYVFHSSDNPNEGCILKISTAYILLYYSYDALITTTYQRRDTIINSVDLPDGHNPLVSSITLSANKAVERVNLIHHTGLSENFSSLQMQDPDITYTYTPAGMYTSVNIPFGTMIDSIKLKAPDTSKVMFNSARLTLFTKELDWTTVLSKTPNPYMLLIHQDSVIPFFHKNKSPNGISSFAASYNNTTGSYTFDITGAVQKRLSGQNVVFSENMVLVPIAIEQIDYANYYKQELWITATMLYGPEADETKKPRLDMIYTQRK